MEKQKITGRSGPTPNLVSWKPGNYALPMKYVVTGHRAGGALALLAGAPWSYYSCKFLVEEVGRAGIDPGQFFLLLLTMGGVVVFLCGLSQFIYMEETTIYPEKVSWRRRGLRAFKAWDEPLSKYDGILREHQYKDRTDEPGFSYTEYSVFLHHREPSKRVLLYEARNQSLYPPPEWEEAWKRYAERLRLPVLEETGEGIVSRAVKDLTVPLLQRFAEGKVEAPHVDPSGPGPGMGISAGREDKLWVITIRPLIQLWKGVAGLAAMALLLGAAFSLGLLRPDIALYLSLASMLVVGLFAVSILRKLKHPEQVAVDKETLWYRSWDKRRGWSDREVALADVLDISVKHDPSDYRMGEQIVIEGRTHTIRFGGWLPSGSLRKLKALILSLVCRGGE